MQYEMIRYLIGGIGTTLVNLSIFGILRYGLDTRMQAANILSIIAAILFAFIVNKKFVFRADDSGSVWKEFLRFTGMRGVSLAVEVFGMQILTMLSVPDIAAKILLQAVIIAMNYVISKCYVFKGGYLNEENNRDRTMSE